MSSHLSYFDHANDEKKHVWGGTGFQASTRDQFECYLYGRRTFTHALIFLLAPMSRRQTRRFFFITYDHAVTKNIPIYPLPPTLHSNARVMTSGWYRPCQMQSSRRKPGMHPPRMVGVERNSRKTTASIFMSTSPPNVCLF